ncbi:hypothetical protein HYQ46_001310 [Verticillium longisporum]|nr:hypothetical protein HYQ46_001310 [Verticillium longisporum]
MLSSLDPLKASCPVAVLDTDELSLSPVTLPIRLRCQPIHQPRSGTDGEATTSRELTLTKLLGLYRGWRLIFSNNKSSLDEFFTHDRAACRRSAFFLKAVFYLRGMAVAEILQHTH